MNIWWINHYALPPTEPGGTRHFLLGRELVRRGHQVVIVACAFDHFARRNKHLHEAERHGIVDIDGVRFLWIRGLEYSGNSPRRLLNMLDFAARLLALGPKNKLPLPRPDVIVGSTPHPFSALSAARLAARFRVPFVLEVRDLWPLTLVDVGRVPRWHPLVLVLGVIETRLYHSASRIISLLPAAGPHFEARGAREGSMVWIPNGVDLDGFGEPTPLPEHEVFTVIYAGAHGLANGLDSLLDAADLLRNEPVRFRFVGQGAEKDRLRLVARDRRLENVSFEDPVPKSEIPDLLGQADALVLSLLDSPLYRFGVSLNKLFDYMASARPVVFATGAANNPISDAGGGLCVPPDDAGAIADAIRRLRSTPHGERAEMGLRGRRYVELHHGTNRLAERLEKTLSEVADRRERPPAQTGT